MCVCSSRLWCVRLAVVLLWTSGCGCNLPHQAEEVEMFHSDKQATQGWTSDPPREWNTLQLRLGAGGSVPVLQACGRREEEPSGPLSPVQVHVLDLDTPVTSFQGSSPVLELLTSKTFPDVPPTRISSYLTRSLALALGPLQQRGFQLGLSYAGTCVFLTSIRLYYRSCPPVLAQLASFRRSAAGSGPRPGSCVKGAVEMSRPIGECRLDGAWALVQGGCTCGPGHEVMDDTCQACRLNFHSTPGGGKCRPCPPNSRTLTEASAICDCLQGYGRLPTDPEQLGCSKPPSAPVNLTAHRHNDSVLNVTWDPPRDRGGRKEVKYDARCETKAEAGSGWRECGANVIFLPGPSALTNTSITVMGLNPLWDYRLSLRAWNHVSSLLRGPPASTATVTIHRWKSPPVVITVTPDLDVSLRPMQQSRFSAWLTLGVLFGVLLLTALTPIAVCTLRRAYTRPRSGQETELLPTNAECSYRHPQEVGGAAQQASMTEGMAQLLEGVSCSLLANLQDVLVERNQLTLGKELGKGEFGSVYEGVFIPDDGVEIKVAVKTLRVGMNCLDHLHEFLREAEIMKSFHHENVVRLLGVTLQTEQDSPLPVPLVLLPHMMHGDLRRFLIATRYGDVPLFVPHQSLLSFMIDIAAGMDYLSSRGFLHRDLAARNCMLGDDLRVSLADFGLSRNIYSSSYYRQRGAVRVPVRWMATESLSESVYTSKSDVWAFGVTMWEIVSRGRTPYPGVQNQDLLDLLLSGYRLNPPKDCDQELYQVMRSCWDQEPNRRPGFGELGMTLKGLLSELPALEASQEAGYINQGLQAALEMHTHLEGRWENLYLPNPAAAATGDHVEDQDGNLMCVRDSAAQVDNSH